MSTCNFYNQSNIDLWVIASDDNDDWFWDDLQVNFNWEIKNLPDLTFHKLELKSGYYSGAQIFVEEVQNPHELDNEDCKYYFDLYKSQAVKKYDAEINRINKKILPKFKDIGFFKINCIGVFSNGEAIYEYAKPKKAA